MVSMQQRYMWYIFNIYLHHVYMKWYKKGASCKCSDSIGVDAFKTGQLWFYD